MFSSTQFLCADLTQEEVIRCERKLMFGDLNETASGIGAVMMKVHLILNASYVVFQN